MPLAITLTTEQEVTAHINPGTLKNKPVAVENPQWEVTLGDVVITPSTDGTSCLLRSGDNPGVSEVVVTADADLGEGVEPVSDVITVTVIGAKATHLGLTADEPTTEPD